MTNKNLAIKLATAEKEEEVINLLKDLGYWDNYCYWRSFGDNDNNFSTIGNQQSKPDAALVEKFINSVDAILMKECLVRGIDMTGPEAPQSMAAALKDFFNIQEGQISFIDSADRNKMAENIIVAATGNKFHMNLTLVDRGEGQTPKNMPETILSVSRNNKLRVPFVQGKFNMGGTGVLPFCGEHRLQLVISKRCPDIPNTDEDDTFDKWSVTIVRRENAREGRRSSMFTYFTDDRGELFRFSADSLPIIPKAGGLGYENMDYGAYFKLFDYDISGYKTNVVFDFNYRMSMLLPELAHPIRIRECRNLYRGHTLETTLSGLRTRLFDDRSNNIEDGFPTSEVFNVQGQEVRCSVYVFKKDRQEHYRKKEGILYVVNGQTHAMVSDSFFNRINLSYLAGSILILVDCSDIDITHREDMFMNSRDRLRGGEFVTEIENCLKEALRNHAGLKKLQNERRAEAIQNYLEDDKPLQDVLQNILEKSPVLSKVLLSGARLTNPFKTTPTGGDAEIFVGKKHPTYFRIKGKSQNEPVIKKVQINKTFRIQFETDAENEYFTRPDERGSMNLYVDNVLHTELRKHLGLRDGIATLTSALPGDIKAGDQHEFRVEIVDDYIPHALENEFVVVGMPVDTDHTRDEEGRSNTNDRNRMPEGNDTQGSRNQSATAGIPSVEEVHQDNWAQFDMSKDSALVVRTTDEGSDYFLNMDNQYLLMELKGIKDQNKLALTRARYKYSMALIGMGVEGYFRANDKDDEVDVPSEIKQISGMIAPVLIPMIESMADLNVGDVMN